MFKPKGYDVNQGYIGFLPDGRRMRFPTSDEYYDYLMELEREGEELSA